MQPPQGYDSQNAYPGGQNGGNMPYWNPPQQDGQWVQRPIPGQAQGGFSPPPGQVPPPAQIMPDPNQPYGYDGGWVPPPENGAPPMAETFSAPADGQGPNTGYQAPKTGIPRTRQRQGKGGYILLTVIVLVFAAIAISRMLPSGGSSYGYVRYGSMSSLFTGDAVVVRSETVISQESVSQIDFEVEEGADVSSTAYPGMSNSSPAFAMSENVKSTSLPSAIGRSAQARRATTPFSVASTTHLARTTCRPLLSAKTTPATRPSCVRTTPHASSPPRNVTPAAAMLASSAFS